MAAQDVRDLTHWKKERDVSFEILRHSGDGDLAERYKGLASASRSRAHLTIFSGPVEVCAMLEQDSGREAPSTFAASCEIETGLSQTNDPREGARLIRAFFRITDPTVRMEIVEMVENIGSALAGCDHRRCQS